MRQFGRIVLGGTFDRFHVGHEALLASAFGLGRSVAIGLTSRTYLALHPKPAGGAIAPEASRRRALAHWLARMYPRRRWSIVPIDEPVGGAAGEGVDALVVSAETVEGGRAVNRERLRQGRPTVPLIVVPLVLADDLEPVSSRRIRAGEIDRNGRRLAPLRVGVALSDARDRGPVERAVRRAFPRSLVVLCRPGSGEGRLRVSSAGRTASRAVGRRGLGVAVARGRRSGWTVAVAGRHARLDPWEIPGRFPQDLERGLLVRLRPTPPKRL